MALREPGDGGRVRRYSFGFEDGGNPAGVAGAESVAAGPRQPGAVKALEHWAIKPPLELAAGGVKFEQNQEVSMVIVAGTLEVDPDQREAFLAGRIDGMRASRAEPGCLEYTLSADPTDPRRVMLFERWARQEDLDNHLAASRARPASPGTAMAPKAASIFVYDVTGERPLGR